MAIGHTDSVEFLYYSDEVIQFSVLKLQFMKQNSKNFRASGAIRSVIQFTAQNYSLTGGKISTGARVGTGAGGGNLTGAGTGAGGADLSVAGAPVGLYPR